MSLTVESTGNKYNISQAVLTPGIIDPSKPLQTGLPDGNGIQSEIVSTIDNLLLTTTTDTSANAVTATQDKDSALALAEILEQRLPLLNNSQELVQLIRQSVKDATTSYWTRSMMTLLGDVAQQNVIQNTDVQLDVAAAQLLTMPACCEEGRVPPDQVTLDTLDIDEEATFDHVATICPETLGLSGPDATVAETSVNILSLGSNTFTSSSPNFTEYIHDSVDSVVGVLSPQLSILPASQTPVETELVNAALTTSTTTVDPVNPDLPLLNQSGTVAVSVVIEDTYTGKYSHMHSVLNGMFSPYDKYSFVGLHKILRHMIRKYTDLNKYARLENPIQFLIDNGVIAHLKVYPAHSSIRTNYSGMNYHTDTQGRQFFYLTDVDPAATTLPAVAVMDTVLGKVHSSISDFVSEVLDPIIVLTDSTGSVTEMTIHESANDVKDEMQVGSLSSRSLLNTLPILSNVFSLLTTNNQVTSMNKNTIGNELRKTMLFNNRVRRALRSDQIDSVLRLFRR